MLVLNDENDFQLPALHDRGGRNVRETGFAERDDEPRKLARTQARLRREIQLHLNCPTDRVASRGNFADRPGYWLIDAVDSDGELCTLLNA